MLPLNQLTSPHRLHRPKLEEHWRKAGHRSRYLAFGLSWSCSRWPRVAPAVRAPFHPRRIALP